MASIRAHGTGYQVQIRKKGFPPQTRTFDKKADAEAWARQTEADMEAAKWQDNKKARKTPFRDILQRYYDDECPKRRGGENQRYKILAFMENPLFQKPVSAITVEDVVKFRNERIKAGCVSSTVRSELSLLSMVFKTAKREWGYTSLGNPASVDETARPALAASEKRDRVADPAETEAILARTTSSFLKPFVRLLAETAARRGELCLLRWERVNLDATQPTMTLTADTTKTAKKRTVPLSPKAVEIFKSLPPPHSGPVFKQASWDGKGDPRKAPALRADSVTQAWTRARTRASEDDPGLADLRIHDQRHTATTALVEDTDLKEIEVASITGHDDMRSLKRYAHPKAEKVGAKLGWGKDEEKPGEGGKASVRKEDGLFVVVINGIEARAATIKEAREMIEEMRELDIE